MMNLSTVIVKTHYLFFENENLLPNELVLRFSYGTLVLYQLHSTIYHMLSKLGTLAYNIILFQYFSLSNC